MIKILNAEPDGYSDLARRMLQRSASYVDLDEGRKSFWAEIEDAHILIVRLNRQIGKSVLERAKNLKAVVSATTGLDHIDIDHASARNIEVLSLRGEDDFLETISATAELALGLMLTMSRHIIPANRSVLGGSWDRDAFVGSELRNKKLAIIGLGRLGKRVARYAHSLDMEVVAYDPYVSNWMPSVVRSESLLEAVSGADIVSLHVPLNADTHHMIGSDIFSAMKNTSILVNTSRGQVIDERALMDALRQHRIMAAALDVVSGERHKLEESELLRFSRESPNLVITPHIGGATRDSMRKTEIFMAQKLLDFLKKIRGSLPGGQ